MTLSLQEQKELIASSVQELDQKVRSLEYLNRDDVKGKKVAIDIFEPLLSGFQDLLWESVIIQLSWLFDEAAFKNAKSPNLFWFVEQYKDKDFKITLDENSYKTIRKFRDKWFAHRDKKTIQQFFTFWQGERPTIAAVREMADLALAVIALDQHYCDVTPGYAVNRIFNLIDHLLADTNVARSVSTFERIVAGKS